ncbi:hypothetical protein Tco_0820479 [Tanacetum coccineum]|uniref:Uncharacterized protein n=1 Tax=Tanacetum coccineum TaxID=301880 RepID=A0ABQ5A9J4_9ASTR
MNEQSHYKQDKTITRQSINVKHHIFNVIGDTEKFEERDLNIGGDFHIDSETISQTNRARSSRVSIPLLDDPYMAVRQAYLAIIMGSESGPFEVGQAHTPAAIDTESEPEEAPLKAEEFRPLAARTTPPSSDHNPISSDSIPFSPLIDEEFEASGPSDTRITSLHSTAPSNSITPLSLGHPLTQTAPAPTLSRPLYYRRTTRMAVRTQPAMSTGISARVIEAMTLSPLSFCKRYRSSYDMPSPASCPTFPIRKRYRGTSNLVDDTRDESLDLDTEREGLKDESPGSKDEGLGLEDDGVSLILNPSQQISKPK